MEGPEGQRKFTLGIPAIILAQAVIVYLLLK